jgi:hypothetical protein
MWLRTRLTLVNLFVEPAPSYFTIVFALIVVCSPLRLTLTAHSVLHTQQFTQLQLVDNSNFDSYAARECTTATSTTVSSTTTTTVAGATSTTATITSKTETSITTTQTLTSTSQSVTDGCVYEGPFLNKKGSNTFRIDVELDLSLSQCLAACSANVDCNGVSYEVGDNFTFCLVVAQPFRRTLLLIHYTRMRR